ncbi:GSCOCG00013365001-RA-CDS, partial [Cotesia congregata]
LFYGNDRKIFGNKWVFRKLIEDIKSLQSDGISITVDNKTIKIYFEFTLVLGDNLGLNGVLGFVESFSAHYPCRICKIKNEDLKTSVVEDKSLRRTIKNYEKDLEENDISKTGLKDKCIFNIKKHFHVCENVSVDIMHDVLEGSGNYAITAIVYRLIFI